MLNLFTKVQSLQCQYHNLFHHQEIEAKQQNRRFKPSTSVWMSCLTTKTGCQPSGPALKAAKLKLQVKVPTCQTTKRPREEEQDNHQEESGTSSKTTTLAMKQKSRHREAIRHSTKSKYHQNEDIDVTH
ncbi:hypothetical protein LWI28_001063 [Acer negundo]|uniref:Uncharacterized protein n=1 Tax=Acer negundo TaxID=4023 RepID=A0AAD5NW50_ACENE|nr:hypothetical protein LWI28_001063 [Acer negundo]